MNDNSRGPGALASTAPEAGLAAVAGARKLPPIVSAGWVAAQRAADAQSAADRQSAADIHSAAGALVIVDIRPPAAYGAGHIPGALSEPFAVPFCAWTTLRDGLLLELPEDDSLFAAIGALGIGRDSRVVVVTAPNPGEPATYGLSNATRVASTLLYAGVSNVAVLDGGFGAWQAAGLPTTTDVPAPVPVTYVAEVAQQLFVSRQYVEERVGRVRIVDARDADVYFGTRTEPFAAQAGHIPGARSLPAPWVWHPEHHTYRELDVLRQMAAGVIRADQGEEVIVYCGVGGYASTWLFLLTQALGYRNVKLYDGAAQDWARHNELVPYRWE